MSHHVYTQRSKEMLKLAPKPFASGGEGTLYKVEMPQAWQGYVVKIYHADKRGPQRERKIEYLSKFPPQNTADNALIWVEDIIYSSKGDFLGFLMPMAKGEKLEILCSANLPRKLANSWYRFHPNQKTAMDLRLKVCYNLAVAVHHVHATGRYVLVDLKPDNVIIHLDGTLSLVDLDSVEVVENGLKLFDAPVATPEFTPPEFYYNTSKDPTQQLAWDRFSLAVIFYKLLTGVHPFAASFLSPYVEFTNLAQKIEQGLYVFHPVRKQYIQTLPPPHLAINKLHPELQKLFFTCFVEGHDYPEKRPTAQQWCSALMQYLDVYSSRLLPSQVVHIYDPKEMVNLLERWESPYDVGQNMPTALSTAKELEPKIIDLRLTRMLTFIGFLLAILAASLIPLYWNILTTLFVLCLILYVWTDSFSKNLEGFDLRDILKRQSKIDLLLNRQKKLIEGIQQQLYLYSKKLQEEKQKMFVLQAAVQPDNIEHEIKLERKRLTDALALEDKKVQQLIDSENFEYQRIKEKYLRLLHTHQRFSDAVSLDAELAAIDFALQEKLEYFQKRTNNTLRAEKKKLQEYLQIKQRLLKKASDSLTKRKNAYKARLKQSSDNAKAKELKRYLKLYKKMEADVERNFDIRITRFSAEIKELFKKWGITSIEQIKWIKPPGIITLKDDRVVGIAPLRYFHIHELVEWWTDIYFDKYQLSEEVAGEIEAEYEKKWKEYTSKIHKAYTDYEKELTAQMKAKQAIYDELESELFKDTTEEVEEIKASYSIAKNILMDLHANYLKEEMDIHVKYAEKYEAVLNVAKQKTETYNRFVRKWFVREEVSAAEITTFNSNKKKYTLGMERLKEEVNRLNDLELRNNAVQAERIFLQESTFLKHCKQLLLKW